MFPMMFSPILVGFQFKFIFNDNIVKVVENYVKKGSTVYIEGALQTRKWTDQQGVEKYSTEIVVSRFKGELTMLGGRSEGGSQGGGYGGGGGGGPWG